MSSEPHIRPAAPADRDAFYDICIKTCDNGADGSHLHDDKDALGNIYVGPYLKLEPQFALALEDEEGVCGYCLATPDSETFYRRFVNEWLPPIQKTLSAPTAPPPPLVGHRATSPPDVEPRRSHILPGSLSALGRTRPR